jgi:MoxR-like ATPase
MVTTTVKSTSQARDLLYRFDALRRLQDTQDPDNRTAREVWPYIHLQPLGKALRMGKPCVVLIDEIDKADIDFPNDLLDVLDSFQFEIDDLPDEESERSEASKGFGRLVKTHPGGVRPIVVITSNREKPLPEPFLRRCLYIQLGFPSDAGTLMEIVKRNLGCGVERMNESLIEHAIAEFLSVRRRSEDRNMQKPPGTSELVDWVRALHWQGRATNTIAADALTPSDKAVLLKLQRDLESWKRSPDSDVPA